MESNVHYPPTARFWATVSDAQPQSRPDAAERKDGALDVVHHGRAVKYRLLEIGRAAKSLTDANKQRMQDSYKKLVGLTRGVMRQASEVVQRWRKGS